MTEQTQELVTKVDVQPDLSGLVAFESEIDRATAKVNELNRAIKRVNELRPSSPYAPPVNNPGATAAAAGLSAGLGANLVSRGALAPYVRKAAEETAKKAAGVASQGVNNALEAISGRALALPPGGAGRIEFFGGNGGGGSSGHTGADWSNGRAGGLARTDDFRRNPFNRFNFDESNFGGQGENALARAPRKAAGGFKMPDMLAGAASAYALSVGLDAVAESMDRIQQSESQLERLPQTIGSSKDAYLALNAAASDVRSNGDAFISTYTNMATATEKLGLSQEQTIKATQGLVSSLQLGGGSKEAVSNALYQMGQAFSSNRFGGDEFRSFMEAIGTMAPEVAKAFGTDVAGLRKMSEQGKLTAEVMTKAFESMADKNMDLLKKQGWTWGQVTTVMKNDWDGFLATATQNGEWAHLMSWIGNAVTPKIKEAEKAVAGFWNKTTDESKASILIGILAAIGAAFTALAIPVLAATWPFLAVGAAVFLLYELFQEFQHWMDGSAKTIFDNLFGSFDEFERRYPNIVKGLKALIDVTEKAANTINTVRGNTAKGGPLEDFATIPNPGNPLKGLKGVWGLLKNSGNDFNPLPGIEKFLGWASGSDSGGGGATGLTPPAVGAGGRTVNNTNSGNTTINVKTPQEAAEVANARDASFVNQMNNGLDNMAEGGGYV